MNRARRILNNARAQGVYRMGTRKQEMQAVSGIKADAIATEVAARLEARIKEEVAKQLKIALEDAGIEAK